jgi:hypothetical protein
MVIPQFFNKVKSIYYEISKVELQVIIGKTRMKRIVIHGLILEYQSLLLLGVFKETKQRRKLNREKKPIKKTSKKFGSVQGWFQTSKTIYWTSSVCNSNQPRYKRHILLET